MYYIIYNNRGLLMSVCVCLQLINKPSRIPSRTYTNMYDL